MGDGVKDDLSRERSHLSKLHVTKRFNQNADEKEFGRFAASKQSRQNRNSVYQFFFHQRGEALLGFDLKLLSGGELRQVDTLPIQTVEIITKKPCWLKSRATAGLAAQHVELMAKNQDVRFEAGRFRHSGRTLPSDFHL